MKSIAYLWWNFICLSLDIMAYKNPWRLSGLISTVSEMVVACLLLLQIGLSFVVLQLMKRFSIGCECPHTARIHHAFFRFGPFSLSGDFLLSYPTYTQEKVAVGNSSKQKFTMSNRSKQKVAIANNSKDKLAIENSPKETDITNSSKKKDIPKDSDQKNVVEHVRCSAEDNSSSGEDGFVRKATPPCPRCDSSVSKAQEEALSELLPSAGVEFPSSGLRSGLPCHGASVGSSLIYRRKGSRGATSSFKLMDETNSEQSTEDGGTDEQNIEDAGSMALLNHRYSFGWGCGGLINRQLQQILASKPDEEFSLTEDESSPLQEGHCGNDSVIRSLIKVVRMEQQHLKTVYTELDEERSAAETAANEAMAMILRLQEEKSQLQLENAHYQRLLDEKALHDEHAIHLLEEDLCRKENERLMLEQELNQLRRRSFSDVVKRPSSFYSEDNKLRLVLEESNETSTFKSDDFDKENVDNSSHGDVQDSAYIRSLQRKRSMEKFRIVKLFNSEDSSPIQDMDGTTKAPPHDQLEKTYSSTTEDASSVLVGLSASQKQLEGAGDPAAPVLNSWNLDKSLISEAANVKDDASSSVFSVDDEEKPTECVTSNCTEVTMCSFMDEEKVVNIDVQSTWETKVPFTKYEDPHHSKTNNSVEEVEKHLNKPGFAVPSPEHVLSEAEKFHSFDSSAGSDKMQIKVKDKWHLGRVTLEEIDSRLKILEHESMLLRNQSVPSNGEPMNLTLLKEILQELQELLHANKSATVHEPAHIYTNKNTTIHEPASVLDVLATDEGSTKRQVSDDQEIIY